MPKTNNEKKDKKRTETILKYRIRGYSLDMIGNILHMTKEGIRQIIVKNENDPKLKNLYREIEKTNKFLNRNIE